MTEQTITATTKRFGIVEIEVLVSDFGPRGRFTHNGATIMGELKTEGGVHRLVLGEYHSELLGITNPAGAALVLDTDPWPIVEALKAAQRAGHEAKIEAAKSIEITEIAFRSFVETGLSATHADSLVEKHHPVLADINRRLRVGTVGASVKAVIETTHIASRTDDWRMTWYRPMPIADALALVEAAEKSYREHQEAHAAALAAAPTCYRCKRRTTEAMSGSLGTLCPECYDIAEAAL